MPLDPQLDPIFQSAADQYGLKPEFLKAVGLVESSGNPNAVGPVTKSGERAGGLMQIMPDTAKYLGVNDVNDPAQAIPGAARYLAEGLMKTGTPEGALGFYQSGRTDYRDPRYINGVLGHYRSLTAPPAPANGVDQLAAAHGAMPAPGAVATNVNPPPGTPDTLETAPTGVAQMAALAGNGIAPGGTAQPGVDRLAGVPMPLAPALTNALGNVGAPQATRVAQAGAPDDIDALLAQTQKLFGGGAPAAAPAGAAAPNLQAGGGASFVLPGQRLNPDYILNAQRQANIDAVLGEQTPAFKVDASRMAPGLPMSPEYQGQAALAGELGRNRQVIGPAGIENVPGSVAADAEKQAAVAKATAEAKITASHAEAAIKAGFDLKPAFNPTTGLPGYVNGLGHFLALQDAGAGAGAPIVSENPYKAVQEAQQKEANTSLDTARNMRRLSDDFVSEYSHIKDPGYGQQGIQKLRKIGQQIFQLSGTEAPEALTNTTSATEASNYISQQLVAQAAKEMSPRLARQLVEQINAVKLSPTITQEGVSKIHKLIYGATQEPIDRAKFMADYYNGATDAGDAARLRNDAITQFDMRYPSSGYNVIANGPFGPTENAKAVEVLRKNPGARDAFERRFGPGSAAMVLGQ